MKRLLIPAFAAAMALSACATAPTLYQPAAGPNAVGFTDYRIEPGRYRITFRGGGGAPPEQVTDFALRRAADLALAEGYDWFRVSDRMVRQVSAGSGPRIGVGVGGGDYGRRSAVGLGVGTGFNLGPGPSFAATVEVFMGRGAKPPGLDVYDARAIRGSLGAPV
ncbi:CC0125/CC1285 family lipoprotein [Phenylobacterium deserti]|uniref:DUF4136 domain-containing protein n=1 Tax=Phenylobacterium deserti TaxID=1914756 RepID=A0A328AE68_9CAUL|nr:hypothetical protein [Phenylobacterium deserti]RAK51048.1 hypothetical protein DJ018_18015 [Phenylobacterium deserti]